jgi:AAA+ ATPase superfamily predicted ATPase
MDEVVRTLPEDYVVFLIDLREHIVRSYDDFFEILFSYEIGLKRKITKFSDVISSLVSSAVKVYSGIPLPENMISKVIKKDKPKNAFTYISAILKELRAKGKIPVVIIDELQTIGDLKLDGFLVYELFNFFITITKRLHLAHVFAVTSDSLFIERVYAEAMLQG